MLSLQQEIGVKKKKIFSLSKDISRLRNIAIV